MSHVPQNDVSLSDGPHIRRWSYYIMLCYVMLCYVMLCYVMLLEETLLNIYKEAQKLGTVDEFCKTDAKPFFSFSYNTLLKWYSPL